jgi:hypothetical protein
MLIDARRYHRRRFILLLKDIHACLKVPHFHPSQQSFAVIFTSTCIKLLLCCLSYTNPRHYYLAASKSHFFASIFVSYRFVTILMFELLTAHFYRCRRIAILFQLSNSSTRIIANSSFHMNVSHQRPSRSHRYLCWTMLTCDSYSFHRRLAVSESSRTSFALRSSVFDFFCARRCVFSRSVVLCLSCLSPTSRKCTCVITIPPVFLHPSIVNSVLFLIVYFTHVCNK